MYNLIKKSFLFLIFSTVILSIKPDYFATCVLPYHWDKSGETYVLIGKERRRFGNCWFDFCGTRDTSDKNSLETAIRELNEETAYQLKLFKTKNIKSFEIRTRNPKGNVIHYFLPIRYIDPKDIEKAASSGKHKNVEKFEWKWVKAQELLNGILEKTFHLYEPFINKLHNPTFRTQLREIIQMGKKKFGLISKL